MSARIVHRPKIRDILAPRGVYSREARRKLAQSMSHEEREALLTAWDVWALPHQRMPTGKWKRWIIRGGRGCGKSTAASNTVHEVARDKARLGGGRIGIIGRTFDDVRLTNVLDPMTGILATAPPDFKPTWKPGPGILTWPNGVQARVFSGDALEAVRGNNFGFLLCDELQSYPHAEREWYANIEPAVRLGRAQIMITMTPKNQRWLRELEAKRDSVRTGTTMHGNIFLARDVVESLEYAYLGKDELRRQELDGEYVEQVAGALWSADLISKHRVESAPNRFDEIVVAVDPNTVDSEKSDDTGIVVFGTNRYLDGSKHGYVLADESGTFEILTGEWANKVIDVARTWKATKIVVESNNGGDHLIASLRAVDPTFECVKVSASVNKETRAEPVVVLYKRGLIHHVGNSRPFDRLEGEQTTWIPGEGKSPNRIDAVVWAATATMLGEAPKPAGRNPLQIFGLNP